MKTRRGAGLVVTPWHSRGEWLAVRELVVARDPRVLPHLAVWRLRVARLPAGVETTASLLEALASSPHTALSLATAVNRFLNHVSHIGMNMWEVTKLHEAAALLSVPEWIVSLRHETSHGQMPGVAMLRAALEYGLSWLETHYWSSDEAELEPDQARDSDSEEETLHRLLECFLYLKLYQVWGTERAAELRPQEEVWAHLQQLWGAVSQASRLHELSIKQAVGIVKTEVCTLLDREEGAGVDMLAQLLAHEDLLVPDSDFMESFDSGQSDKEVEVPENLILIWSDFINIIDRQAGVRVLVDRLMARLQDEERAGPELAAAWVVVLVQGMLGRAAPACLAISPGRVEGACLEAWLQSPTPLTSQLADLLAEVAGVTDPRLGQLVRLYTGAKLEARPLKSDAIYTEADLVHLVTASPSDPDTSASACEGWQLDTSRAWDTVARGAVLGPGDWTSLWLEAEWCDPDPEEDGDTEDTVPSFEIPPVDWSSARRGGGGGGSGNGSGHAKHSGVAGEGEGSTPHFYSNTPYVSPADKHYQDLFRRRKRLKKA